MAAQFRPEFLNRIDEVIRFRPLQPEDLVPIVRLQLAELAALLAEQEHLCRWMRTWSSGWPPRATTRNTGPGLCGDCCAGAWKTLATELLEERYQGAAGVHVSLEEGGLRFSQFCRLFVCGSSPATEECGFQPAEQIW